MKKKSVQVHIKRLISETVKSQIKREKKQRSFQQEKAIPVPTGMESITFQKPNREKQDLNQAKILLQKNVPRISLEQFYCTQNQNYPLFFIEKAEAMQLKKIQNIKIKERWIAVRNLRNFSYKMQKWIHQEVEVLGKHSQEFYDFMQQREERHFQIDRIIRYLSDS